MLRNARAFSSFSVDDIGAAKKFYRETLGVDVTDEYGGDLLSIHAGGCVVMIYPKHNHRPASYTVLNFRVQEIERTVDALRERGVTFESYPELHTDQRGISRTSEGPPIAWFKDPAGNILSVVQEE